MILRFSIDGGPALLLDDEMTDTRMTPEVVEDYMRRLREQGLAAYRDIVSLGLALDTISPDDE